MANFEMQNFNLDFNFGKRAKSKTAPEFTSRYIKPKDPPHTEEKYLKYDYAEKLVNEIELHRNCRYFVIVNGTFYFGDYIEALFRRYNFHAKRLIISTLSLNHNNVDSLANLLDGGFVDKLDLIVSTFFFGHERHKEGLIPYLYKELDKGDKFQLAVASTHCKIAQFETHDGIFINIHGSANLRTSDNLEQIVIEDNESLYEWNEEWQSKIIEKYKTIKKMVRSKQLWEAIK